MPIPSDLSDFEFGVGVTVLDLVAELNDAAVAHIASALLGGIVGRLQLDHIDFQLGELSICVKRRVP